MKLDKRVTMALVAAAATGAGVGVAYYLSRQRAEVTVNLKLEQAHVTWLQEVADKYTEGDSKRALQTLIEHFQDSCKDSATEETIFEAIRCNTCGKKEKVDYDAIMTGAQLSFVKRMTKKHDIAGEGKTLRVMFEYSINEVEEAAIFGQ